MSEDMKTGKSIFAVLLLAGCAPGEGETLPDKLVDVTVAHIKRYGPDDDTAQFIATERSSSWERREEIADATIPYLKSKDPDDVAGALAVLCRLRGCCPMHDVIGTGGSTWEQKYKPGPFWARLDQQVTASFEHVHALRNAKAFHNLALYLGVSPSADAKQELLRIANETPEKEQAVICLAWHRDPKDMDCLLPFMLEDSCAARSLPYHFRNAYGVAAVPYLEKAVAAAKSDVIRRDAKKELSVLNARGNAEQDESAVPGTVAPSASSNVR